MHMFLMMSKFIYRAQTFPTAFMLQLLPLSICSHRKRPEILTKYNSQRHFFAQNSPRSSDFTSYYRHNIASSGLLHLFPFISSYSPLAHIIEVSLSYNSSNDKHKLLQFSKTTVSSPQIVLILMSFGSCLRGHLFYKGSFIQPRHLQLPFQILLIHHHCFIFLQGSHHFTIYNILNLVFNTCYLNRK